MERSSQERFLFIFSLTQVYELVHKQNFCVPCHAAGWAPLAQVCDGTGRLERSLGMAHCHPARASARVPVAGNAESPSPRIRGGRSGSSLANICLLGGLGTAASGANCAGRGRWGAGLLTPEARAGTTSSRRWLPQPPRASVTWTQRCWGRSTTAPPLPPAAPRR